MRTTRHSGFLMDWGLIGIFCIMMLPMVAGGITFVLSGMSVEEARNGENSIKRERETR